MNSNGTTNIHIIDDDRMLIQAIKNEIEKNFSDVNVQVSVFENGEVYAVAAKDKPDVAIIDFHLDSKYKDAMNGVKVIDFIKKRSADTEVVMVTGEENAEIAVRAMHHGAHDYIVKNDNMFRKLNMAVYQCLKLRDLKEELKMQKKISYISAVILTLLIGTITTISLVAPHTF